MRSLCTGVVSVPACLCAKRLQIGCLAIAVALSLAPAAPSQDSAKKSSQTAVTTPPIPQVSTADAANDRIALLAQAQAPKKGDYVLDSGDLLGVEVFDVPELTRDVRVSESGLISLPLLPVKIRAQGLTAFQLQDKLAELLMVNGLVSNPQVTVSVKEQHGQPITVMGAVKTPMVIQAVRQMTLLEVLSRAGGIADDAAGHILVTHAAPAVTENPETTEAEISRLTAEAADPATTATPEPVVPDDPVSVRVSLTDLLDSGRSEIQPGLARRRRRQRASRRRRLCGGRSATSRRFRDGQ